MKILRVGAELIPAEGQTDGHTKLTSAPCAIMRTHLKIKNGYDKRLLLETLHVAIRRAPPNLCPDAC
jgi:hypothetical protein